MGTALQGKTGTDTAKLTTAAAGNTQIIPGVAGKRIRVFAFLLSAAAANNVKFQSNTTDISLITYCPATGGIVVPTIDMAWFSTAVGEALNLNLSAATSVSVQVQYDMVE